MSCITLNYLTNNARGRFIRVVARLESLELNEVPFTKGAVPELYKAKFPQCLVCY